MRALYGIRRSGIAILLALTAAATVGAGPALAGAPIGDPTFGPHTGTYGLHALVDTFEYPAARCVYGSDNLLKSIRIRKPIIYGVDRTSGTDTQTVGWRYRIEYQDVATAGGYANWPDWYVSPIVKTTASDAHNAQFQLRTFTFGGGVSSHTYYRVSMEMLWYYPNSTTLNGKAVHLPNYYYDAKGGSGYAAATDFGCPNHYLPPFTSSSRASGSASPGVGPSFTGDPTSGPHSGNFGVHALIDSGEYAGATCFYGADHLLKKISYRRPIVYGFDRTGGTDTQSVGYKATIEYYDGTPPSGYTNWPDVHVGSLVKTQTTDKYNAQWSPGSYVFGSYDVTQHSYYRVSYTLLWYYPSSTNQDGRAVHQPFWYQIVNSGVPTGLAADSNGCYYTDNVV